VTPTWNGANTLSSASGFARMPADFETVVRAGNLAKQFHPRGYDALHLATADRLRRETGSRVGLLGVDAALYDAAAKLD
jgi:hypothetical protein